VAPEKVLWRYSLMFAPHLTSKSNAKTEQYIFRYPA